MSTLQTRTGEEEGAPKDPVPGGTLRMDALAPAGGLDSIPEAPPTRRVPTQAIFVLVLLAIAGGALYGMRRMGMGPIGAVAEPPNLDYDYTKRVVGTEHKKVLEDLNANHVEAQVPPDDVQKNPFKLAEALKHTEEPQSKGPEKRSGPTEAEARADLIKTTLAGLHIHGILDGTVPVARVNDQTVRVGDTVAGILTVTAIKGRLIELTADDQTYTIALDDQAGTGPHKTAPMPPRPQPPRPQPPGKK
jgi:hypothetical protein